MKKKAMMIVLSVIALATKATPLTIWMDTATQEPMQYAWERQVTDQEWEQQTLPIGNGSIGASIFGSVGTERFTLNEKTLWRGGPNTSQGADAYWNVNKKSAHLLKEIRAAFERGDSIGADLLTRNNFNSNMPGGSDGDRPFRFGNYTTMGECRIETGVKGEVRDYRRSLSLNDAVAEVSFKAGGQTYRRSYFVSYPDNVMVMRYEAGKGQRQNLTFIYTANPESDVESAGDGTSGIVYRGRLKNNGMAFVVRVTAVAKKGNVACRQGRLEVRDAEDVVFILTADTDYKQNNNPDFKDRQAYVGEDPEATTKAWIESASRKGYETLLKRHEDDYHGIFDHLSLRINDGNVEKDTIPTPRRLEEYRKGAKDYYLETLYCQYGRYLLISSSRKGNLAANLQGIWHNNIEGPWNVDYHNNINIQMNYWPACPANMLECVQPMFDYISSLMKSGSVAAKDYFGARGWTAGISSNIFGFASPQDGHDMSWNFNPMAGPWLATHIWEYYDYTRDNTFLRDWGYEVLKQSARFVTDYMWKKDDGTYTAAPSTSPEHGPIDEGATFVHGVAREALCNAISASEQLGEDAAEREQWRDVLEHLAPYKVGRYGQLMEWSKDIDDPNDEHRHVNHLFGVHPGRSITPTATPTLAAASRVVLEHRGDGATGWSMGWKLNMWARLQDGNHAYLLYGNLLKHGTYSNLWDKHPPFQIDGNLGGSAGIMEMLLQSHEGFINLLPALPDAWQEGEVKGIRARGNFEVDIKWHEARPTEVRIHSGSGGPCTIGYGKERMRIETKAGQTIEIGIKNGKMLQRR